MIKIQEAETHCNEIRKSAEQQFYIYQGVDQLVLCCRSTFGLEGVKILKEIPGTANQDSFDLKYLLVKTRFRRPSKEENSTYTAVSAHLFNTAAKRREVCQGLTGPNSGRRRKFAQTSLQVTSLPRPTANAGRREVSFIEGTWEETRLLPPSGPVQLGQMKETEDCCGFVITKQNEPSWRVARHGSFQLNKDKMQIEGNRSSGTPSVYIHLCKAQTNERSIRSETA